MSVGFQQKMGWRSMGKTYKDHKEYDPTTGKMGRKSRTKLRRGCAIHGDKNCEWCMNNLTIEERRNRMPQWDEENDKD
jgi:hypothetical protein